ncbi:uncharacterized protein LOC135379040 isoform X4 [Ornithodoros turicata]|uniref:uncharacterized protein LOC135379040 isoform X4 n=1 Tax=Ornithodoros turicata TaxID=34597 RepID=UPI003138E7E8
MAGIFRESSHTLSENESATSTEELRGNEEHITTDAHPELQPTVAHVTRALDTPEDNDTHVTASPDASLSEPTITGFEGHECLQQQARAVSIEREVSTCSMQVDSGVIRRDSGVIRIPEQLTQDDFWYDMGYENGARKLGQCVIINFSASRRDEVDIGVRHDGPAHTDAWSSTELLPGYDDFFGFYATSPGQHAYRDEYHGSFFIQTLCDVLERSFRFNDFLTMMTLVQFYVSEKEIPFLNQMTKQMPNTCSTLRKNLRFAGQEVKMGDELSRTQPCRAVVHSEQRTHSQERPPSPRIENSRLKEDGNLEIVSSTEIIWRPNKVQKFLMIAELMDDHHLFSAKFLMLGYMFHMRLRAIEGNEKPYLEVALFLCQGPNDDALTWPFNTEHAVTLKHPSDNDFYVEREAVLAAVHRYQKPESEYNVGTIFIKLSLEKLKKHGFIHDDALCLSLKFYPKGY